MPIIDGFSNIAKKLSTQVTPAVVNKTLSSRKRKSTPQAPRKRIVRKPHLSESQTRAAVFIAILILAGIAIVCHVFDPVVWTFLGAAIGRAGLRGI